MSVCIFDSMLRPALTVCDMNEADKTMRKYWLVAVMLLALCWGAEAECERTYTLDSLGRERDELLVEVKTLQENTLRRVKGASPVLADRLVYEMHKGITACRYSLSKIATAIEEELYEGRQVSEEEHQLAQKRIPYANVGLAYECIAPEVKEHEVQVYASEQLYKPFYPYISKELSDFIELERVDWVMDGPYALRISPSKSYPTEASYIAGLERYIQAYPDSRYLAGSYFKRGDEWLGVSGVLDLYNNGSTLFIFRSDDNLDRFRSEHTWRVLKEYLTLLPKGNLLPVIKEILKMDYRHQKAVRDRLDRWLELLASRRVVMPHRPTPKATKGRVALAHRSAQKMSKELAKLISLQNSSEELCTLEEESIAYDPREKMLSVCVTFSWPNRDDDTSPHELSGLLVVYPSPDGSQSGRARFYYDRCSRSLMNISPATALQKLAEGYEITLK